MTQIEIMPQPPVGHNPATPWPLYPQVLKTSSSHEEGCIRRWNLASVRFIGDKNTLKGVEVEEVEWLPAKEGSRPEMRKTGRTEVIEADLVFLAMGFIHPEQEGLVKELSLAVDTRGNIAVDPATNQIAGTNIFGFRRCRQRGQPRRPCHGLRPQGRRRHRPVSQRQITFNF